MKKIFAVLVVSAAVFSCAKNEIVQREIQTSDVEFVGRILNDTKVNVDAGKSAWESGDQISVFSVADGAAAGVSVGTNVIYKAVSAGAESGFTAVSDPIAEGAVYYAFSPAMPTYPYPLKAYGDFSAVGEGDAVTDYRYMPIAVNRSQTFTVDPETGLSENTSEKLFYYATGTPAGDGQPVELDFEPAVSILEFAIYGTGTLKQFKAIYADESVDKADQANNVWLTGKGVLNIADGSLITTNLHGTQYGEVVATITEKGSGKSYVNLSETTPVRLQFVVGRFTVPKGLTLTFIDKDGKTTTKSIWKDKIYTGYNEADQRCKHIFQPVVLPAMSVSEETFEFAQAGESKTFVVNSSTPWSVSGKPEWVSLSKTSGEQGATEITVTASANNTSFRSGEIVLTNNDALNCTIAVSQDGLSTSYYTLPLGSIDWTVSNVHYAKDASDKVVAMVAKEYFGYSEDKQGIVVYPMAEGEADYTSGFVAELTLNGGQAVSGNVHGGSISFTGMSGTSVSYSAGTSAAATSVYIVPNGGIIGEAPSGISLGTLATTPLTVVSDVKSHPCTKVGTAIWLAANYQTTKLADGTAIKTYARGDTIWSNSSAAKSSGVAIWDGHYMYSFWTFGYVAPSSDVVSDFNTERFAPAGWHVATQKEIVTDLAGFLGSGNVVGEMWNNACGQALLNWATTGKVSKSGTAVDCSMLSYGSVWTSTGGKISGSSKGYLCGFGPTDKNAKSSAQPVVSGFCARLVKD